MLNLLDKGTPELQAMGVCLRSEAECKHLTGAENRYFGKYPRNGFMVTNGHHAELVSASLRRLKPAFQLSRTLKRVQLGTILEKF